MPNMDHISLNKQRNKIFGRWFQWKIENENVFNLSHSWTIFYRFPDIRELLIWSCYIFGNNYFKKDNRNLQQKELYERICVF